MFFCYFIHQKSSIDRNVHGLPYAESVNKLRRDLFGVMIHDMDLNILEKSTKLRYLTKCMINIRMVDLNEDEKVVFRGFLWESIPKNTLGSERYRMIT